MCVCVCVCVCVYVCVSGSVCVSWNGVEEPGRGTGLRVEGRGLELRVELKILIVSNYLLDCDGGVARRYRPSMNCSRRIQGQG